MLVKAPDCNIMKQDYQMISDENKIAVGTMYYDDAMIPPLLLISIVLSYVVERLMYIWT